MKKKKKAQETKKQNKIIENLEKDFIRKNMMRLMLIMEKTM